MVVIENYSVMMHDGGAGCEERGGGYDANRVYWVLNGSIK
jgi:hypothetical protein